MRAALRDLAREHGDIKHLEGPLQDYFRLRIRDYRIIFQYAREGKTIQCLFAERRSLIYEIFERTIHEKLFGPLSE